jgi:hypothetical protein
LGVLVYWETVMVMPANAMPIRITIDNARVEKAA